MKGPVFSVPVGEIKPQGVYDIPPTQGVSELVKPWVWMSISVWMGRGWGVGDVCQLVGIKQWHSPKGKNCLHEGRGERRERGKEVKERSQQLITNL